MPANANPETTEQSRFLRCTNCGHLITRLEWGGFKFSGMVQCCKATNLQPHDWPVGETA